MSVGPRRRGTYQPPQAVEIIGAPLPPGCVVCLGSVVKVTHVFDRQAVSFNRGVRKPGHVRIPIAVIAGRDQTPPGSDYQESCQNDEDAREKGRRKTSKVRFPQRTPLTESPPATGLKGPSNHRARTPRRCHSNRGHASILPRRFVKTPALMDSRLLFLILLSFRLPSCFSSCALSVLSPNLFEVF